MDLVAEVVALGRMLVDVFQCPGAGDDGLDTEDVGLVAVNLGLDNPGDIGLKLDIVDEEELAILSHGDL